MTDTSSHEKDITILPPIEEYRSSKPPPVPVPLSRQSVPWYVQAGRWEMRWDTRSHFPKIMDFPVDFALAWLIKQFNPVRETCSAIIEHFQKTRTVLDNLPDVSKTEADITLSAGGDVMWVYQNAASFLKPCYGKLPPADFRFVNLETLTASRFQETIWYQAPLHRNSPIAVLKSLEKAGVDLVTIANNHLSDLGSAGLESHLRALQSSSLDYTGVHARTANPAHTIYRNSRNGVKFAIITCTFGTNNAEWYDTANRIPLQIDFGKRNKTVDLSPLYKRIRIAKDKFGVDLVIVTPHWMYEFEYYPAPHFMIAARKIVSMGADVILGHGPHVTQPVELLEVNSNNKEISSVNDPHTDSSRTAVVIYSMGDVNSALMNKNLWLSNLFTLHFQQVQNGIRLKGLEYTPYWSHRNPASGYMQNTVYPAENIRSGSINTLPTTEIKRCRRLLKKQRKIPGTEFRTLK